MGGIFYFVCPGVFVTRLIFFLLQIAEPRLLTIGFCVILVGCLPELHFPRPVHMVLHITKEIVSVMVGFCGATLTQSKANMTLRKTVYMHQTPLRGELFFAAKGLDNGSKYVRCQSQRHIFRLSLWYVRMH